MEEHIQKVNKKERPGQDKRMFVCQANVGIYTGTARGQRDFPVFIGRFYCVREDR